jgi:acetylornithine deacetylase
MDPLEHLLCDLVAINSVNPHLDPGAPGEGKLARFMAGWLEHIGLEVQMIGSVEGRPNVVATARGTGGGQTLLLNGHMDTVSVGGMPHPFEPVIRDGMLFGRGAYDMKGGLAACMVAISEARKLQLRGDVVFTAVIDEEYASLGTQELAKHVHSDGAIVAEFSELQMILAHRGFVWMEVETTGRAAHGSRPDLGVDAIAKMGKVLVALEQLDQRLRLHPSHPLLGSGSLHASLIQGGKEPSTYPDKCVLTMERRTLPGESAENVEAEVQAIINHLRQSDPQFQAVVRRCIDRDPLETPTEANIVRAVQAAAGKVLHVPLPVAGVPFWTDAARPFCLVRQEAGHMPTKSG